MFLANNLNKGGSLGGYQISRSLRFNSADSAYLNRTPASATNRRTYTFSTWVKRSQLNSGNAMLATVNGSAFNYFSFGTSTGDFLTFAYFDGSSDVFGVNTNSSNIFYRDVSAWYHIVLYVDTTQATASNRVKFYVNNVEQTGLSGTYPTQNYDTQINSIISTIIGGGTGSNTAYLSDQYMTEINFIDGQALTPSSFGETNAQTGVWQPKAYSGSYGTNGFYLNFSDNSNTTAATLGKDYSGNGNNWTPNNFSVTAGAGNDSLVDSPTSYGVDTGVGGTVRGNYCTLNPLGNLSGTATLTNGNLDYTPVSGYPMVPSTFGMTSGKWYWEYTLGASGNAGRLLGIVNGSASTTTYIGNNANGWGYYGGDGKKFTNATATAYGSSYTNSDVIGVAFDADAGTLVFYKNNTSQGTAFSSLTSGPYFPAVSAGDAGQTGTTSMNFGQRPFAYTAPSGFKALCTQNLPTPTIGATTATTADKFFTPVLYTGTGSSQSITTGFQPDFLWIKNRSGSQNHYLQNAVIGATNYLVSNNTGAENQYSGFGVSAVTAFTSNGFSLSTDAIGMANTSGQTYVGWNWKANGAGSTNTAGSITSTVSANTTSGFSVVTYTGTGSVATVGHGLGSAPYMVIVKRRNGVADWATWHISIGTQVLFLNTTDAAVGGSAQWNGTIPTSSVFTVSTSSGVNGSGGTYVAYCFAEVAGYSKIGSFIGTGSLDSPFVYCGFRPAYVLIKNSNNGTQAWNVQDATRSTSNVVDNYLRPNTFDAEASGYAKMDFVSNGFKIRDSDAFVNGNGNTMIFMAFAQNPFKYSIAR